jgi:aspartyl-tRNA synthetase
MSFITKEEVFTIVEGLMKLLFKEVWGINLDLPITRLTYEEALSKYGSDKPDLRFDLQIHNLNEVFSKTEFKVFKSAIDSGGVVAALVAPDCASFSRNQLDGLTNFVKDLGSKGLVWFKVTEVGIDSPTAKFLSEKEVDELKNVLKTKPNDLILILAGDRIPTLNQMGSLRLEMAKRLELIKPEIPPSLLWVTDFPLFEWDEETKRFYAMHHPFTSPKLEEVDLLEKDPGKIKAQAYDLVLNGSEIAGGSIRIHNSKLQSKMFKALGINDDEAEQKFGFLINAFKYGAPPHGGIAFGFDRMVMLFAGVDSIRDTIAFPKTASALSLMDDSPSVVNDEQLKELHLKLRD